ncbi:MAG TPA: hypothetical protein VF780_10020 [Nitrosospira sp.]
MNPAVVDHRDRQDALTPHSRVTRNGGVALGATGSEEPHFPYECSV